jgi:hypothetical protein
VWNAFFVFSQQDALGTGLHRRRFAVGRHDGGGFGDNRQIDFERRAFADFAVNVDVPAAVAHETPRGRLPFHPVQTHRLLEEFPDLRLCCDFSHWVYVCERRLEDQRRTIALCTERAWHVHACVGYPQGPQVPDPGAPEYAAALSAHLARAPHFLNSVACAKL